MSQLGLGVMMHQLMGNKDSVNAFKSVLGQKITKVFLDEGENALRFEFENGIKFRVYDGGQSCCESRYMRTDDDLSQFDGAIFMDVELKNAPDIEIEYDTHEVQFLEIKTDKGSFVCSNHNEHNGYYGGFWIIGKIEE